MNGMDLVITATDDQALLVPWIYPQAGEALKKGFMNQPWFSLNKQGKTSLGPLVLWLFFLAFFHHGREF